MHSVKIDVILAKCNARFGRVFFHWFSLVLSQLRHPADWVSFDIQRKANELGSPTESTISIISEHMGRDIVLADKKLKDKEVELLEKGLDKNVHAPDTVYPESLKKMIDEYDENQKIKEKLEDEIY